MDSNVKANLVIDFNDYNHSVEIVNETRDSLKNDLK